MKLLPSACVAIRKAATALLVVAFFLAAPGWTRAAEKGDAKGELQELLAKIQAKLMAGKNTEKDLADELRQFDILLVLHRGEKTDAVAEILQAKAMLYFEVFNDTERGVVLMRQLKADFPGTAPARKAESVIVSTHEQAEAKKLQGDLVEGAKFPDFVEKDLNGRELSLPALRGRVVLVQFWASWSYPCASEAPALLKAYEQFHDRGFDIIGVSLDRDQRDLLNFTKKEGIPWPQYFDGKGWNNNLAVK